MHQKEDHSMREPVDWPMHARSIRNLAERVQLHGSIEEAQWLLKAAAKIDKRIPSPTAEARNEGSGQRGQVVAFASHRTEPDRRSIQRHEISQEAEIDHSAVQKTTYR